MNVLQKLGRAFRAGAKPETIPDRGSLLETVVGPTRYETQRTYVTDGITPEDLTSILKSADTGHVSRQSELFSAIEEKDSRIGGVLQTRRVAVSSLKWEIIPASSKPEDEERAAQMREYIQAIPQLRESMTTLLDAIGRGYSGLEIHWEYKDNQLLPSELTWVHPSRWTFYGVDSNAANPLIFYGTPQLLTDENPSLGIPLQPFKFIFHRARHRAGYPNTSGLCRALVWYWLLKNYSLKDWAVLLERYSMPFRYATYPDGTEDDEKLDMMNELAQMGTDGFGIVRDDAEIHFVDALNAGHTTTNKEFAEYLDKEITILVLGHAGLSEGTPGKLGNEQAASDLRQDLLAADAMQLEETLNDQLLLPISIYNFGEDVAPPRLQFSVDPPIDLQREADRDIKILGTGIATSERAFREKYNIPAPESEKDELVIKPQSNGFGGLPFEAKLIRANAADDDSSELDRIEDGQKKRVRRTSISSMRLNFKSGDGTP